MGGQPHSQSQILSELKQYMKNYQYNVHFSLTNDSIKFERLVRCP